MKYELYYWPQIQGRGEFVRLALEECGAEYVDVAREPSAGGIEAMLRLLGEHSAGHRPFAPPFLRAGELLIGQTANILDFLGARHSLAPTSEAGRRWTLQLQLTLSDLVDEVHDTHHPIAGSLYYEDQKPEAERRAGDFVHQRLPKFLDYFEQVLQHNTAGAAHLVGERLSYADLSLFQLVAGLQYAYPHALGRLAATHTRVMALHEAVKARPRIRAYLVSPRRVPFNQKGIFRRYPELDPP
jgi:glutathione S-transferase